MPHPDFDTFSKRRREMDAIALPERNGAFVLCQTVAYTSAIVIMQATPGIILSE